MYGQFRQWRLLLAVPWDCPVNSKFWKGKYFTGVSPVFVSLLQVGPSCTSSRWWNRWSGESVRGANSWTENHLPKLVGVVVKVALIYKLPLIECVVPYTQYIWYSSNLIPRSHSVLRSLGRGRSGYEISTRSLSSFLPLLKKRGPENEVGTRRSQHTHCLKENAKSMKIVF